MAQKFTPKTSTNSTATLEMRVSDVGMRAARAEKVANESGGRNRTGDISPGIRDTLGKIGTAADLAGQVTQMLTGFAGQKAKTQFQKDMQKKLDKLNETSKSMGDTRDKMSDLQGKMDALQSTLDSLAKFGCDAKDDLDKYQKEFDDAKQQWDQAKKDLSSAQDKADRAYQEMQNMMNNNPYPNTPAGRKQWNNAKNQAIQNNTQAQIDASNALDAEQRAGNGAYNSEAAKNAAAEKLQGIQDQVNGVNGNADGVRSQMSQAEADYMNKVSQQKQTLGEIQQSSRDYYDTMMNQARISQGGSTASAVGNMFKDIAAGNYYTAGSRAVNTTLDWMKLSGTTGAATPMIDFAKLVTTGVAQGIDRGQSAGEIAANIQQSLYGYNDLMRSIDQGGKMFNDLDKGDVGGAVTHGFYAGSAFAQSAGITASNVLPFTPYAMAAPFAQAAGNMVAATLDSWGQDASIMNRLDKTAGNQGEMFMTGATSAPFGFLTGGAKFFETMTGNQGWFDTQDLEQWRRDFNGEVGRGMETEWNSMFKAPEPITGDLLQLPDNPCKQQTGDPTNTKNPGKNPTKPNCPKPKPKPTPRPIEPRAPYDDDTGTGTGSVT